MDLAIHAEAGSGRAAGLERVVRGECNRDVDHDCVGSGGVVQRDSAAVSEVLFVPRARAVQQLSDDYVVSDPGELFEVDLGSVGGGFVVCGSDVVGSGRGAVCVEGFAGGGEE